MIKLNLPACPATLTPAVQHQLTEDFKTTQKAVWKKSYIEKAYW